MVHALSHPLIQVPPLAMLSVHVFWGVMTGHIIVGVAMGLFIEYARISSVRWDMSLDQIGRVVDFCLIATFMVGFFVWQEQPTMLKANVIMLQWLPVLLHPILLVQYYSSVQVLDLRLLFILTRSRVMNRPIGTKIFAIHLSWVFFFLCMFSASVAKLHKDHYFICCGALIAWVMAYLRPKHRPWPLWGLIMICVLASAFMGQRSIRQAHVALNHQAMLWIQQMRSGVGKSNNSEQTALGRAGKINLSDQIELRLTAEKPLQVPYYLTTSVYNNLHYGYRWTFNNDLISLSAHGRKYWNLYKAKPNGQTISITMPLSEEEEYIPIPDRSIVFQGPDPETSSLKYNPMGMLNIDALPGQLRYTVNLTDAPNWRNRVIEKDDLRVPGYVRPIIEDHVDELELRNKPFLDQLRILRSHFHAYRYTLEQAPLDEGIDPVDAFLNSHQSGHCEFFATVTVLLLRELGIPARYSTGYVVQEYSEFEDAFVVRGSHAHAWVQLYHEGRWHVFDTTPPGNWQASKLRSIKDIFNYAIHKFREWRWQGEEDQLLLLAPWLIGLLLVYVTWRIGKLKRKTNAPVAVNQHATDKRLGPLDQLSDALAPHGLSRQPFETPRAWLNRLNRLDTAQPYCAPIGEIITLHEKICYSPRGSEDERLALDAKVTEFNVYKKL